VSTAGEYRLLEGLASETKSAVPRTKLLQSLAFVFRSLTQNELLARSRPLKHLQPICYPKFDSFVFLLARPRAPDSTSFEAKKVRHAH